MSAHARPSHPFRLAPLALLAVIAFSGIAAEPAQAASHPAAGRTTKVSDRSFQDDVLRSAVPVLVEFGAPWCVPCHRLEGSLALVARDLGGRVRIVELDASSSRRSARRYGVEALPTLILFSNGQLVERATGALSVEEIKDLLGDLSGRAGSLPLPSALAPVALRPAAVVAKAGAVVARPGGDVG